MSSRLAEEIRLAPMTPILHPSPWRVRLLGLALCLGHPLFGWMWLDWAPQPYENLALRGLMALVALALLPSAVAKDGSGRVGDSVFIAVCWLELPFFFSWMYLHNAGNSVWMASVCAMILIYYHLTDWRVASIGLISGAAVAWTIGLAQGTLPDISHDTARINAIIIAFSWGCALLLGLSSANLRRAQLEHSLATLGIMAHELRTPLSTISLLADAMQSEVLRQTDPARANHINRLAERLRGLVHGMNHQIDTQIINARLLQLPRPNERVGAAKLVEDVLLRYPFRSQRDRDCVTVSIREDFVFLGSSRQFGQVLDNLLKNALYSLAAASSRLEAGAVHIEVSRSHGWGRIVFGDQGMGIDTNIVHRIFDPFFSTNVEIGHGLGLAFCKRVVDQAGGTISVRSLPARGAIFTIELPVAPT